ncbi:hypothetical protein GCM10023093_26280 [Nemorincola caseinilytica]|uniref:Uncharacterized protein n=2 Tax=Nemorincola caseinilytica TaxID=2054315 RepID=A0ABP8NKD4_9BACT
MNIDTCLDQLAQILRSIGVEELVIDKHSQFHLVDRESNTDQNLMNRLCIDVAFIYEQMMGQRT